ncbi:MAG TPA: indole-3-glycerol phosphate synthase TrpC [Symbiobacteriaceae bacterium]|nr:indole-3-glycerol phosphate synthase TrpC [Symbiobacteriaceae bacterium]
MILDQILATKRREVAVLPPLAELERQAALAPKPRGFKAALARASAGTSADSGSGSAALPVAVIAEVKKASPSKGIIRPDFDPVAIARSYEVGGAAALSVLTDASYFQGQLDYLKAIRAAVELPLLRKDFIIEGAQILEARAAGADAVLLIVAAFAGPSADSRTVQQLAELLKLTRDLGMDALVEVHDEAEMQIASEIQADLIGINNRDLRTFVTDLAVTERVAKRCPPGALLVSESGLFTGAEVRRVHAAGARAILVGESLMRQPEPGAGIGPLLGR